ncbi:MAG: TRAP transporter small permease subunit [Parvularculaceae bacterium]
MLTTIGDILNWFAAGVLFPLMIMPLAALLFRKGAVGATLGWAAIVAALVAAGALFAWLAPRLATGDLSAAALYFGPLVAALGLIILISGGPLALTRSIAPALAVITRAAGRIAMWFVLAMALVQFAGVILRYVFGVSFIFMQESITYMHGAVFLLAGGYALLTDDHVRVDIFYRSAAPRRKALIDFAGTYLFLFPVSLLILATTSGYVGNSWAVGEGSNEQSGVQAVFLLKSLIPAFAVLMAMAGFVIAARAGEKLRSDGA